MKRFLILTDFSDSSQAAVGYGLELAERVDGEAFLLHVVEGHPTCRHQVGGLPAFFKNYIDPDSGISFYPVHQRVIYRDLIEEAQWRLAAMVPPRYHDRVRAIVTAGNVVDEVIRVAREQRADLIMTGSQRRGALRRLLRRTMAERVGRKVPIPVIVVDADRHVLRGTVQGSNARLQHTEAGDVGVDGGTPPAPRSRTRTRSRAVGV
jgi:nucleotide-binding universal stress UspA family protein